ncbi:enolase C-terminal domain-like protein [Mesorhizobium sp. M0578]|uniref:enolase C-terminal domain-like protein n=1 Tax=unclassified Mesorhizobium TaxID=325217 RepID=UPI00333D32DF
MFGFAWRYAEGACKLIAYSLRPFMLGRDPPDRDKARHEFRTADRWWGHLLIYKYLGGYREQIPLYASSMILPSIEAYGEAARSDRDRGFRAYKLHTPGNNFGEDLDEHRAAREAAGPDFALISNPVCCFNLEQEIRFGRELERLDYSRDEEPLFDEDVHALHEMTRTLVIPLSGTKVLGKHPDRGMHRYARRRPCAANVSWTSGVTGVMKTASLAEAFGVNCEGPAAADREPPLLRGDQELRFLPIALFDRGFCVRHPRRAAYRRRYGAAAFQCRTACRARLGRHRQPNTIAMV